MPRTETCGACNGAGEANDLLLGDGPCRECGGNGYIAIDIDAADMAAALEADGEYLRQMTGQDHGPFPSVEAALSIDLTDDTPPPGRMANQTWRILEEQRMAAEDTIKECEHEIERWTAKLDDAMKTTAGCRAGQAALDGGV